MRWYGPKDPVPLEYLRQAGATGIVSALHDIPTGLTWPAKAIEERKAMIERAGLSWSVVESVNVHESIKTASVDRDDYIERYRQTLTHLGKAGIKTVCYNFMPALDWCRTDLSFGLSDGSRALRFERQALLAFDLFILNRPEAHSEVSADDSARARKYFDELTQEQEDELKATITLGIPGSSTDFTMTEVQERLDTYRDIDSDALRRNLKYFLTNVIEVAEEYDIKLCIHPDDPPFSTLGLPRIVSTEADAREIVEGIPSPSNGLCLCTGSYGARADNDLPGMVSRLKDQIHFIHLRNVKLEQDGNFREAGHLEGDTDMYAVMKVLVEEQQKRDRAIPMRPDHGHAMLDDLSKDTYPGYTAIGRLKGLAELRGLEYAIVKGME